MTEVVTRWLEWASQLADEARGQRQEGADLQARLDLDERTRDRNRELNEELVVRGKAAGLWQRLHELIGRNDGGAFQRFATSLGRSQLLSCRFLQLCTALFERFQVVSGCRNSFAIRQKN